MNYREHSPHPALEPFVRCFWHLCGCADHAATLPERVVPDGCPEIVLDAGDRFRRVLERDESRRQEEVLLVGQFTRSIFIAPEGEVDLLGIRFEPGGLFALLGVPMHELTDRELCMGQVDSPLWRRLADAGGRRAFDRRQSEVERVLWEQLRARGTDGAHDISLVACAARAFEGDASSSAPVTSDAVARGLGVNRRSLERAFRREVGLSPKQYRRIRRLQGVIRRIEAGGALPGWAALAAEHGYSDQPHLIRDFRLISGTTPERYRAEQTTLADFFSGATGT